LEDLIKRALTRRRRRRGVAAPLEDPDERLVIGVKLVIALTLCLTGLEVAHMAILGRWNSEIFSAITGLSGTVVGLFVGQKT
jgi:hypothetical protein